MGRITAPNLTTGEGGVAGKYTDGQLARAIRHGVGADGKSLAFMPSRDYFWLPDDDLGALVSWIRSVPPVDGAPPPIALGVLPRVLDRLDVFPVDAAGRIDHDGPRPVVPAPSSEPEYGRFLAISCSGCHGESFTGGPIPGAPPSLPPASNLTRHGDGLETWSRGDFAAALRSGVRPDGTALDPFMPVKVTKHLTDSEIDALWAYFGSLPPGPTGT